MHGVVDFLCCNSWFHHQGCNVQHFSCQLGKTNISKQKWIKWKTHNKNPWKHGDNNSFVTLHTTLMPSMSSGDRILICDVPFRNCSDSDIPVRRKQRQTMAIIHMLTLSEADELTETGPYKTGVTRTILRQGITLGHRSCIYILLIYLGQQLTVDNKPSCSEKAQVDC